MESHNKNRYLILARVGLYPEWKICYNDKKLFFESPLKTVQDKENILT